MTRSIVIFLVLLGALSGILRAVKPATVSRDAEQIRSRVWHELGLREPDPAERRRRVAELEARYAENPRWMFVHATTGSLFLLAATLQFLPRLRTRYPRVHRWNGRVLVAAGMITAITGLYFGILIPAAGLPERIIIALVGAWFVTALINAVVAIRRHDAARHRKWMTRAFAVAVGIATVRLVALIADAALTPRGWVLESVFVLSLALGWGITIIAAELWMARTGLPAERTAPNKTDAAFPHRGSI